MTRVSGFLTVSLKKAVRHGIVLILAAMTSVPLLAWKPSQHVALGMQVLSELQDDSGEGSILINGIRYSINSTARAAILSFPVHYLMGCIGPDAYPDIYFGQCVIHPDTYWTGDNPPTISDQWLRHILQMARQNLVVDGGRALALAYGFITHAAGDMWCHTFVNKYAGGVWPSIFTHGLTIPKRHIVIESYMDDITGSTGREFNFDYPGMYSYLREDEIHQFLYTTFYSNDYARQLDSSKFFGFFHYLQGQLDSIRGDKYVKDIDDLINALPGDFPTLTDFIDHWHYEINKGMKNWMFTSSRIAISLFFVGGSSGWEQAGTTLQDWAGGDLPAMLGAPEQLEKLLDALDLIGKNIDDFKDKVIKDEPFKTIYRNINLMKENLRDWVCQQAFGMSFDQLKEYWLNPETWLANSDPDWFGAAPFGMNTKSELDNELAYSIGAGGYDALKFDAAYNTIAAGKLLLLDGTTLNQLLALHGYIGEPLYGDGELEDAQMCAMLGFMRSLDADHQWMKTSPDGEEWGLGRMRMWENAEARERAFKKIFHMGLDMTIKSQEPLSITPGLPGTIEVEVADTENQPDTFHFSLTWAIVNPPFETSYPDITVTPGNPQTLPVQITAPRDCTMAPGLYSYTLTGKSVGRPWIDYDLIPEKIETGSIRVLPFYEVDISTNPGSQTTWPGGTESYSVELRNKGNVSDAYSLTLAYEDFDGAYEAWPTALQPGWVSIGTTAMNIGNCDSQATNLSISIPSDWAGMEPTTYTTQIIAQSQSDTEAEDNVTLTIVVQPTKASKARYIDLELLWLKDTVGGSAIGPDVKASLLEQLTAAINKKEQALAEVLNGRGHLANNMLKACQQIVKAFVNLAEAQSGKAISSTTAAIWIAKAQIIIGHIGTTISTE